MLPSFWVASTKSGAALARGQGWLPWQGRAWFLAQRDRGPEAGEYCLEGALIPAVEHREAWIGAEAGCGEQGDADVSREQ